MGKISKQDNQEMTKSNLSDAIKVADRVDLKEVRLLNCECNQAITNIEGKRCIDLDKETEVQIDKQGLRIFVIANLALDAYVEGDKENPFADIGATFLLVYSIASLEGLEQKHFDSFGDVNAIYNVWPYWREFVQSMTTRMSLPPLTLPVFRIVSPKPIPHEEGSKESQKSTAKEVKAKTTKKKA